jgi:hypothetical protein
MATRARQTTIPGTTAPTVKAVESAAEVYVDVRDERMGLTKREVQAREKLIAVMKTHGLTVYRLPADDGEGALIVTVSDESKVTVRKEKPKAGARDAGEERA